MPLSDRDYMRSSPPGRSWSYRRPRAFSLNPVWVLIGLNLVVFIITSFSRDAFMMLGLIPAAFLQRPWTIFTNIFVHSGFWHLFGNMITLYFFGMFLSRLVGQGKFLLVYLVGGVMGSIFYLWLGTPLSIAVGASGAVYAVAGAMVMLTPKIRVLLYFFIPLPLWVVVLVFMVVWSFIPGVAWQAHLGGLATGLIAGYFFRRNLRRYYFR